jgi:hypothetical protein
MMQRQSPQRGEQFRYLTNTNCSSEEHGLSFVKNKEVVMMKLLPLLTLSFLLPITSAFPQTLNDYVKQVKGDTLVIKDYSDMNNQPNSLYWALALDTVDVPAGRVYELKANGYYPLEKRPTTLRNTIIVGEDNTILVKNGNAASRPPLICGTDSTGGIPISNAAAINVTHDLTVKNCNIIELSPNGFLSYSFINPVSPHLKITFDNCLVEHLIKDFLFITQPNYTVTLRNCYFVNMNGFPCRRSGGVLDCFADLDTLLVENCTHIMAQGSVYRLRDYAGSYNPVKFKRIIFNHNTFVNCAGYVFMNPGFQSNVSLTNNMLVNCNVQCFAPILSSLDVGETDPDNLPMGLVNVYPDSADVANNTPRKFLCQDNLAYWDPSLANMDSILNANKVNDATNWRSQKIIMNTRTDSVFKHLGRFSATPYSSCISDTWKNKLPAFTDTKDLFTTQLANLKTFALATIDTTITAVLPDWRLINTGSGDFLNSDWPIPIDLSYNDADLQTAGLGHFPLGDLNWFPTQKAAWLAQKTAEYAQIQAALDGGASAAVKNVNALPAECTLHQNYPNPFNPATRIEYELPASSRVSLTVYDVLGREIQTLVDERQSAGNHSVTFNAGNLPSGVYFYRVQAGNYSATKKLLLLK